MRLLHLNLLLKHRSPRITTYLPFICRQASNMASKVPKAEYKQLGRSGLRVSVPILGAMSFGDKRWQPWVIEADEALPLLKAAYDRGLNTWDTANVYSNGVSEEIIGKAIKKYDIPRQKVIICTKCCGTVREGNSPEVLALQDIDTTVDYVNQRGLSRQAIFAAVNASLARLDTPYIDLLQTHRFDKTVPIEETMKALHDLVESGKVHYIGERVFLEFCCLTAQSWNMHFYQYHLWKSFEQPVSPINIV